MNNKILFSGLLIVYSATIYGQDMGSTVSDSVRAMIERSQASNRYEQMARMQVGVQYEDFLDALANDAVHRNQVEDALVAVLSARAELSAEVSAGRAQASELLAIGNYAYLRENLAPLLNSAELALLDSSQGGPSEEQIKKDYAQELSRTAPDLSEANRELVLDTLVKHISSGSDANSGLTQYSVDDLVAQQSRAIMRARQEIMPQVSEDEMRLVDGFLSQLQINLNRNRFMLDDAQ